MGKCVNPAGSVEGAAGAVAVAVLVAVAPDATDAGIDPGLAALAEVHQPDEGADVRRHLQADGQLGDLLKLAAVGIVQALDEAHVIRVADLCAPRVDRASPLGAPLRVALEAALGGFDGRPVALRCDLHIVLVADEHDGLHPGIALCRAGYRLAAKVLADHRGEHLLPGNVVRSDVHAVLCHGKLHVFRTKGIDLLGGEAASRHEALEGEACRLRLPWGLGALQHRQHLADLVVVAVVGHRQAPASRLQEGAWRSGTLPLPDGWTDPWRAS